MISSKRDDCRRIDCRAWRFVTSFVFLLFFAFSSPSAEAQTLNCPKSLGWKDATRLQRSSYQGATITKTEWKKYRNATVWERQVDGVKIKLIDLGKGIYLTFGNPRPSPKDFDNLQASVASPMWDSGTASLLKFATPCVLKENESQPFNEKDFIYWKSVGSQTDMKIFGSIKRLGLTMVYSMEIQRGTSDEQLHRLYGVWEYQAKLDALSDQMALRDWHLFRDNEYVETISATSQLTLGALLSRVQK